MSKTIFNIDTMISTERADIVLTIDCSAATFYFFDEKHDIWLQVYKSSFTNPDNVTDEVILTPMSGDHASKCFTFDVDEMEGCWELVSMTPRAIKYMDEHTEGKLRPVFEDQIPQIYKAYLESIDVDRIKN